MKDKNYFETRFVALERDEIKMKIGLVLSGGGVKGSAHIGAIEALEENGIKISAVAGTSIGSIVGSLYAMGYTTEEMLKLFRYFSKGLLRADPKYLMNNIRSTKSILGSGIISGQSIEDAIEECGNLKGIKNIKDIKMPIAIPTVDIKTGKEIVFTNRSIDKTQYVVKVPEKQAEEQVKYVTVSSKEKEKYIDDIEIGKAVRASCSYPGLFSPMIYKDYKFVDGGVLDNVPVEEVKKLNVDKIITIKFPPRQAENPRSALNILSRSLDIIFDDRDTEKTRASDYIINVDVTSSSTFDIKKIDECYKMGYEKTMSEMEEIKKVLEF